MFGAVEGKKYSNLKIAVTDLTKATAKIRVLDQRAHSGLLYDPFPLLRFPGKCHARALDTRAIELITACCTRSDFAALVMTQSCIAHSVTKSLGP